MRLKPVPESPEELSELSEYQRAVPLVPGPEDCCSRLRDRFTLPNRQVANDWLAFLRVLGLVEETSRGFKRTDADPTPERVRSGIREEVLFAPETLELLRAASPDDPVTADDLFDATRESVPRHDRSRNSNWESTWRDRADRLLRWLALVDLAERVDGPTVAESDPDDETGEVDDDARRAVGYVAGDAARLGRS